jgi:hypothetical protein
MMGALGVKKGVMGTEVGSRESAAGRKRWRKRRPGDAVGGIVVEGPWWIVTEVFILEQRCWSQGHLVYWGFID